MHTTPFLDYSTYSKPLYRQALTLVQQCKVTFVGNALDDSQIKQAILHEIQHAVQDKEKWSQGGRATLEDYDRLWGEQQARATQYFPATKKDYAMLVRTNGKDKGVVVDLEIKGGKYRVRSAIVLDDNQLQTKLKKAKEAGDPILQFQYVDSQGEHPLGGTIPSDIDSPQNKIVPNNDVVIKGMYV